VPPKGILMTPAKERVVAWFGTLIAVLYFAWLGMVLTRGAGAFRSMFEGLGAELPAVTRLMIAHRLWLFPVFFGLVAVAQIVKEVLIADKRLSMMLTMLSVICVRWVVDGVVVTFYLPMMRVINALSG